MVSLLRSASQHYFCYPEFRGPHAGVSDAWIKFLKKFQAAPLNMAPVSDVLLAFLSWRLVEDDEIVIGTAQKIIDRAVVLGKEMGVHHPLIYQNYAAKTQHVFAGYSVENHERLRRVQKEVDPERVSARLQPGVFSL